jgi:hypothetical protein
MRDEDGFEVIELTEEQYEDLEAIATAPTALHAIFAYVRISVRDLFRRWFS